MAEDDDGSKSHAASEQKLRKAREKGDVPTSKEAMHIASYGAVLVFCAVLAPRVLGDVATSLGTLLTQAPLVAIGSDRAGLGDLRDAVFGPVLRIGMAMAQFLGLFVAAAIIGGALQGPFVVATERIRPKLSKISPMSGLKRLAGVQNLVEFGKNLLKLSLLVSMSLWLVWELLDRMMPGSVMNPEDLPRLLSDRAGLMLTWICALMVPVAMADMVWKRLSFMKKQRMSTKEVRDEHKESEGDPQLKARRDQIRRARARQRLATAVPTATLVITNPTHYAVALKYERGVDQAPVCVAKGADLVAAKVRALAHENNIPVIESRALARALYAVVEVDEIVPEAHWAAVAELVSFVFDLGRKVRRKPPEGASIRED